MSCGAAQFSRMSPHCGRRYARALACAHHRKAGGEGAHDCAFPTRSRISEGESEDTARDVAVVTRLRRSVLSSTDVVSHLETEVRGRDDETPDLGHILGRGKADGRWTRCSYRGRFGADVAEQLVRDIVRVLGNGAQIGSVLTGIRGLVATVRSAQRRGRRGRRPHLPQPVRTWCSDNLAGTVSPRALVSGRRSCRRP